MQIDLELSLYHLSIVANMGSDEEYSHYQGAVAKMLYLNEMHIAETEILHRHQKQTMEEVFEQVENGASRYFRTEQIEEGDNKVTIWYDTWADYIITEKDPLYGKFFTYKIRQIGIFNLDDFLNYQLTEKYEGNFARFTRFLTLTMREYAPELLDNTYIKTANEWLQMRQAEISQESVSDEKEIRIKGRPKRTGDDKLTALNQEQTVLLIHYLQKAKVFYHGEFLTNKQAGQAFHILTGYSADTIRQKLANHELDTINSKKNLTDLANLCDTIKKLISNELGDKK
jgi:hypothetical protein